MTGVQNVSFNATHAWNFIKPGTGSVAIMIVSESTQTEIFTDLFEVTTVSGIWPKPALDVGGDLNQDWRFDAPGWGAMGRQDAFDDGTRTEFVPFPFGGGGRVASFLVPQNATPTSASVVLRSEPDPHTGLTFGGPLVGNASGSANFTTGPQRANAIGETSFVRLIGVTSLNN